MGRARMADLENCMVTVEASSPMASFKLRWNGIKLVRMDRLADELQEVGKRGLPVEMTLREYA